MRIPRVQKMLQAQLEAQGGVIRKTVDMDRAVSMGKFRIPAFFEEFATLK